MQDTLRILVIPTSAAPFIEMIPVDTFAEAVHALIRGPIEAIELLADVQLLAHQQRTEYGLALNSNVRTRSIRGTLVIIQHDHLSEPISLTDECLQAAMHVLGATIERPNSTFTFPKRIWDY